LGRQARYLTHGTTARIESLVVSLGLTMSGALAIDYTHTGDRPQVNTRRMWLGSGNVEEETWEVGTQQANKACRTLRLREC